MSDGNKFTRPAAQSLSAELENPEYTVLFDHGGETNNANIGEIIVWYGTQYDMPRAPKQLAHLDIAVIRKSSNDVLLLVEIEDSQGSDRPKTVLGDAMATLSGDGVNFKKNMNLNLGSWTSFVICLYSPERQNENHFSARIKFLHRTIEQLIPHLKTPNAVVGRFIIERFGTQQELDQLLKYQLDLALDSE